MVTQSQVVSEHTVPIVIFWNTNEMLQSLGMA